MKKKIVLWGLLAVVALVGLVVAALVVFLAARNAGADRLIVHIAVGWEGATSEVVERELVEPLEEVVSQVKGVSAIASRAGPGSASILVRLDSAALAMDPAHEGDMTVLELIEKVDQAQPRLPPEAYAPVVSRRLLDDRPVAWVGVSGSFALAELGEYARYLIKERLQRVQGVREVTVSGMPRRELIIRVDARRLEAFGLTVPDVAAALQRDDGGLPSGQIGPEPVPSTLGAALELESLRRFVVGERDGTPVFLSDVALIEDGLEPQPPRKEGRAPFQGLVIHRQRGARAEEVASAVSLALAELQRELPPGLQLALHSEDPTRSPEEAQRERLELSVRGADWERLVEASQALGQKLQSSSKAGKVDTDHQPGVPELRFIPDRARAAELRIIMDEVTTALDSMVGGVRVGTHVSGGRRVDVRLRVLADERSQPEELTRIKVRTGSGELLPLSSLVRREERPPPPTITRRERERAITLSVAPGRGSSLRELRTEVERFRRELPQGVRVVIHEPSQRLPAAFGGLGDEPAR
jgi:multidrug efflux pump subunit AcrB